MQTLTAAAAPRAILATVSDDHDSARSSPHAALLAVLLAAVVLWLYRRVVPIDLLVQLSLPVLWLSLWSLACLGAGHWPTSWLLGRRSPLVVVLATGAALVSFLEALLALTGAFRPAVLVGLLVLSALGGVLVLARPATRPVLPPFRFASPPGVLVAAVGVATLILLTTPPVMYDALNYHLAFPARWLAHGSFLQFPRQIFSYYPSAHGVLYALALATVGPWGATAIHWWMGALAALSAATLAARLGGRDSATWAAACFVLTPVVLAVADYAIADLAVAAWTGAALVVLTERDEQQGLGRRAALVGLLVGTAVAAKYLALATVLAPVALGGAVMLAGREWRGRRLAAAGAALAALCLVLAPWMGRNLAWTGNPVYPYFQAALGGPQSGRDVARELAVEGDGALAPSSLLIRSATGLIRRTFHPLPGGGAIGPAWLILLPVALVAGGDRSRARLALWIATATGVLAWGALVQYARFLLPVLVPAAALAGVAAARLTGQGPRLARRAVLVLLLAVFAWNATALATDLNLDRLAVVTGHTRRTDFLSRWVSYFPAAKFASERLPKGARLLLVAEVRSFYLDRPVLVEDPYRVPWLVDLARSCAAPSDLAAELRALGVTHVLVNEDEMPRLARQRGVADYWAGADERERDLILRFLHGTLRPVYRGGGVWIGELPPAPSPTSSTPATATTP